MCTTNLVFKLFPCKKYHLSNPADFFRSFPTRALLMNSLWTCKHFCTSLLAASGQKFAWSFINKDYHCEPWLICPRALPALMVMSRFKNKCQLSLFAGACVKYNGSLIRLLLDWSHGLCQRPQKGLYFALQIREEFLESLTGNRK